MSIPNQPKIYHITHLHNLPQLAASGWLWSDAKRLQRGLDCRVVGMVGIKRRRLEEVEVKCHPGTKVGQYAPFYFCPRSIMLYILHRGNHPDVSYKDGQRPILHLQADLKATVQWADDHGVRWAFSDRNAGAYLAQFFNRWEDLAKVSWQAVESRDFRESQVREGKQAEFLLYNAFPWTLVEAVGVVDEDMASQVENCLAAIHDRPPVNIMRDWYF